MALVMAFAYNSGSKSIEQGRLRSFRFNHLAHVTKHGLADALQILQEHHRSFDSIEFSIPDPDTVMELCLSERLQPIDRFTLIQFPSILASRLTVLGIYNASMAPSGFFDSILRECGRSLVDLTIGQADSRTAKCIRNCVGYIRKLNRLCLISGISGEDLDLLLEALYNDQVGSTLRHLCLHRMNSLSDEHISRLSMYFPLLQVLEMSDSKHVTTESIQKYTKCTRKSLMKLEMTGMQSVYVPEEMCDPVLKGLIDGEPRLQYTLENTSLEAYSTL
jgi:hypothetical protein